MTRRSGFTFRPFGLRPSGLCLFGLCVFTLCLVGFLALSCGGERRPNVILITMDTTRPDHLGCYGDQSAHTPTIDSLAAAGVRFAEAVTPVPLTCPAHTSILTGLNPTRHGIRDNGLFVLDRSIPTLAGRFSTAGYQTAAFVSAFVLARQFGLDRGFDVYDDRFYNERRGIRTTQAALRWAQTLDRKRPFFLWVHYFDPHAPYQPLEPFRSMNLPTPYDGEIAAMDAAIGSLLGGLRARGLLRNTILVATGDHGEGLGAHGEDEHGLFLYDTTVRVPVLIDLPRGPRGRALDAPVSLIDLAPTMLDAAGLPPLERCDGTSLVPLIGGRPWAPRRAEYCETFFPEYNYNHSPLRALRTPRWKYIRAPQSELYNLADDAGESSNLLGAAPDTVGVFVDRLDRYLASVPPAPSTGTTLSAEDLERLRSLGYLSGGEVPESSDRDLPDPKELLPFFATFTAGKEAMYAKKFGEAARCFEAVLARNPENVVAARGLGDAYLALKQPDKAVQVLLEAWRRTPQNASLAKHLGEAYRKAGRPDLALEPFRIASHDPYQHWAGVLGMFESLMELGRYAEAKQVLASESGGSGAQVGSSDAGQMARDLTARVDRFLALREKQEKDPYNEALRLDLANAAFDLHLTREAARLLQFQSRNPQVEGGRQRTLGNIAGTEGDDATALAAFERARAGLPGDPYIYQHLTTLYLEMGRPADALEASKTAAKLAAPDPILLYNQACAYARLGEVEAGLNALDRSIQLGYANASKILEDPDLAPLQGTRRFMDLAERASRR